MKKRLFTIAVILSIVFSFAGCKNDTTYSVKFFDSDGVTQIGETQSLTEGFEFNIEKAPEKDGLQFDGWTLNGEIYDFEAEGAKLVSGDMKFVAQYSVKKYTISYYDGETLLKEESLGKDATITPPEAPEKDELVFDGWTLNGEIYDFEAEGAKLVSGDMKFVAQYSVKKYTISYYDGETLLKEESLGKDATITPPEAPEKDELVFDGWTLNGEIYDFEAEGAKLVSGDMKFVAQYSVKKYTISYYDGETLLKEESLGKDATITPPEAPEKDELVFDGWTLNGEIYDFEAEGAKLVSGDMKFVAQYSVKKYTISYYDGETLLKEESLGKDATITPPEAPTKDGYAFKGWVKEGETDLYDVTTLVNGDLKLVAKYAKYTLVKVTLPLAVGGETVDVYKEAENVTFDDINEIIKSNYGYKVTAFKDGDTVAIAPENGKTYVAENISVDVTFNYVDGTSETIKAIYGEGLVSTPKAQDPSIIDCNYAGDYNALATNLTVTYSFRCIGDTPTSQVFNEDGSYTVTADSMVSTGLLMNSYDISGKSWMAEVNVKISTLSLWQTYGIAIRYDSGNYLILGAGQRASTSALLACAFPNGAWKGEFETTNTPAILSVRNTYLSQENLNVKVTYYGEQYYLYFNDVLYRVFSADEIGVSDYGVPVAVGFGFRLDDSLPKSLTFSDWDYCVEGDAKFEDPTNDAHNMLNLIGDTPTSQVINEDGSYTVTTESWASTGLLMNSYDISGKSWMAEVNVKISTLSLWQTYGIAIRYDSGNYLILGASQRASTSALGAGALPNGAWKGELETTNSLGISSVRNTYLSQENLNVKVTYYGEQYYLYFNDVLYRVFSADEIGVSDYGVPVAVGFGFRLDDSLPKSLTFSDWDYCVEGDAKFEDPTNDVHNMLNLIGDTPTSQVINEDGLYTVTTESWASTGLLMNSYDISGKNWMAEVNVKISTLSLWQTYGIAIRYDSGNYLILGASQRASADKLYVVALPNGGWLSDFETTNSTAISSVRSTYLTQENLNVKVLYKDGNYSVYFNDVLYRVFSASEIGVSDYGAPVAVGFGYRLDDGLPKSLTFSDWDYCVEGDTKYSEFLSSQQA